MRQTDVRWSIARTHALWAFGVLSAALAPLAGCASPAHGSLTVYREAAETAMYEESAPDRDAHFAFRGSELIVHIKRSDADPKPTPQTETYPRVFEILALVTTGEPITGEVWLLGGTWHERYDVSAVRVADLEEQQQEVRLDATNGKKRIVVTASGQPESDEFDDLMEKLQATRVRYGGK